MTFKLPEPDRMVESIDRDVFGSACGITKHWSYSEGQLKQFGRDVLEAAAQLCDVLVNDENSDDYKSAADWCATRVRALKESIK